MIRSAISMLTSLYLMKTSASCCGGNSSSQHPSYPSHAEHMWNQNYPVTSINSHQIGHYFSSSQLNVLNNENFFNKCKQHNHHSNYNSFQTFTVFFNSLPFVKKLFEVPSQENAYSSFGFNDYEARVDYYYMLDQSIAISKNKIDSNFALFFLNRFNYYIDLMVPEECEKCPCFNNKGELIHNGEPVDLLNLKEPYKYLKYSGKEQEILNYIISTSTIRGFVVKFLQLLLKQIKECAKANSHNSETLNTYTAYIALLEKLISKIQEITNANLCNKINYLKDLNCAVFALIPIKNVKGETISMVISVLKQENVKQQVLAALSE